MERTYRQWNGALRDLIRTETALRLTVGNETQAVPVHVVGGMPRAFGDLLQQLSGLEWLLLHRPAIEAILHGTAFFKERLPTPPGPWTTSGHLADLSEIDSVYRMAYGLLKELDETKAVGRLAGIREDVLGAYYFRVPEIRLYRMVIGIMAALSLQVEALTIVVLAHELAHAYTHLGRDIDNEKWDTEAFAGTDLEIIEGLAQFYTVVACKRLGSRAPAARALSESCWPNRPMHTRPTKVGLKVTSTEGRTCESP